MKQSSSKAMSGGSLVAFLVISNVLLVREAFLGKAGLYWWLLLFLPLLLLAIYNVRRQKHAIHRNYPVGTRLRYLPEVIRRVMKKCFFESALDGGPLTRQ